jgi:hypothetical protein
MPAKDIALVSTSRSGSNWLLQLLGSSKSTNIYGEIGKDDFLKNDSGKARIARDLNLNIEELTKIGGAVPSELVEKLKQNSHLDRKAFGCKIFYYHIEKRAWIEEFLLSDRTKVIHLFRNYIFETFTSLMLASKSGNWLGSQYPDMKLDFDRDEYIKYRKFAEQNFYRWFNYLETRKKREDLITVEYSLIGTDKMVQIVRAFLSLEDLSLPALPKQSKKSAVDYWKDFDSIQPYIGDRIKIGE